MNELLYLLKAIQLYVKDDAHYHFYGVGFKSLHEWADEITEPISDYIDEIKESYLLRNGMEVPRGFVICEQARKYIPNDLPENSYDLLKNIRALLEQTISAINGIESDNAGDNDLLGRLCSHLNKHVGLLNLALKEVK